MRLENGGTREYVLGHSESELIRLERQAEIFAEPTEQLLRRAGVGRGMRVLDIGCGVGDVAMAAARLVGAGGSVLGIDRAGEALGIAARRAERAGFSWLTYEAADLHEFEPQERFDAITGRFILMYLTDPAATIRRLSGFLKPGGVLAFAELDIDQAGSLPELPLLLKIIHWTTATYRCAGIEPNMGSKLFAAFSAAGMSSTLVGTTRIEGGENSAVYDFAAETIRSLLPSIIQFGIATEAEVGLDTLVERLHAAATAQPHCFFLPRLVGGFARPRS
ncbi:MAG TPA: methyltransferase domain-containing protein [Bauldia sp.]|nr:methyltransferase domain-containing protein [Bauldia sp.]